jgi:hypothetical protein
MKSEHNDRPKHTRKRREKLKWLMRNTPMEGARALERVMAKEK